MIWKWWKTYSQVLRVALLLTVATLLISGWSGKAAAAEVSGVRLPDTVNVGEQTLHLNGAGLRYAAAGLVRVYVASVYLPEKQLFRSATEFDRVAGSKRLQLSFLREVRSEDFSKALIAGIRANLTPVERGAQFDSLVRLGSMFAKVPSIQKGGTIVVDHDGKTGTATVYVNGRQMDEPFPNKGFFNALMKLWLGPNPIEPSLKPVLLGNAVSNDNSIVADDLARGS